MAAEVSWKGKPVPPVVETWMDALMSPEWAALFDQMKGRHIDITLYWTGSADRPKRD